MGRDLRGIAGFPGHIGIPLCYSITDGLTLRIVSYPLVMIFRGRIREVHWLAYILATIFFLRYLAVPLPTA